MSCETDSISVTSGSFSGAFGDSSGASGVESLAGTSMVFTDESVGRLSVDGDVVDGEVGGVSGESSRVGSGMMLGAVLFAAGSVLMVFVTVSTRTGISIPDFAYGLFALGKAGSATTWSELKLSFTGVSAVISPERVTLMFDEFDCPGRLATPALTASLVTKLPALRRTFAPILREVARSWAV